MLPSSHNYSHCGQRYDKHIGLPMIMSTNTNKDVYGKNKQYYPKSFRAVGTAPTPSGPKPEMLLSTPGSVFTS